MADAITYTESDSGFYSVKLNRVFDHEGFRYKPSMTSIVVNEDILLAMIAAEVVEADGIQPAS